MAAPDRFIGDIKASIDLPPNNCSPWLLFPPRARRESMGNPRAQMQVSDKPQGGGRGKKINPTSNDARTVPVPACLQRNEYAWKHNVFALAKFKQSTYRVLGAAARSQTALQRQPPKQPAHQNCARSQDCERISNYLKWLPNRMFDKN